VVLLSKIYTYCITLIFLLGKSSLGWINPSLYLYHQSIVNDIIVGNNKCPVQMVSNAICCAEGFSAKIGWDPGWVNTNLFVY
jgi:hypothetical protein